MFGGNLVDTLELVKDSGQRVVRVFVQDIALSSWASARRWHWQQLTRYLRHEIRVKFLRTHKVEM